MIPSISKYWADKEKWDQEHPVQMVRVNPTNSPNFNLGILKQNIDNASEMNDEDLYKFISRSYKKILSTIFEDPDQSPKYIKKIQNERILDAMIKVFSQLRSIDYEDGVRINTICYHYITMPKDNQDYKILNRLLRLSDIVNKTYKPSLLGIGLNDNLASMLLISRFSDINLEVCIRRVDYTIINQPPELMTEVMIEKIFRILFDCMNQYPRMFGYLMHDTIPEFSEHNETTWWVTNDVAEVDSYLGLAILNILDTLPSQLLRDTLVNYTEGCNGKPIKFSLQRLSDDYYRTKNIIYNLYTQEGILVP